MHFFDIFYEKRSLPEINLLKIKFGFAVIVYFFLSRSLALFKSNNTLKCYTKKFKETLRCLKTPSL